MGWPSRRLCEAVFCAWRERRCEVNKTSCWWQIYEAKSLYLLCFVLQAVDAVEIKESVGKPNS